MSKPLIVYSSSKSAFAEQVTSGEVDSTQVGIIADTGEFWAGGTYHPLVELKDYIKRGEAIDFAKDLSGVIESTPEVFVYRASAGDKSIRDDSAVIRRIKGYTTLWNQQAQPTIAPTIGAVEGSTIVFNDTITTSTLEDIAVSSSLVKVSGHKYLFRLTPLNDSYNALNNYTQIDGSNRTMIGTSKIISATGDGTFSWKMSVTSQARGLRLRVECFDLTNIFGAGYEPMDEVSFRKIYSAAYYPYSTTKLLSMRAQGIECVGFNQFDKEQTSFGTLTADGTTTVSSVYKVARIKVLPETNYYLKDVANGNNTITGAFYTDDMQLIHTFIISALPVSVTNVSGKVATPKGASYMQIVVKDIHIDSCCVNLSHSGQHDGNFAEYKNDMRLLPEVSLFFPNGMNSIGEIYDEINDEYAIQRLGTRLFESGDSSDVEVVTDGESTVYVLEAPVVTPVKTTLQLDYRVEDFGTEQALFEGESSPIRADIVYQFNAKDRIRDNSKNIERIENEIKHLQIDPETDIYVTDFDVNSLYNLAQNPDEVGGIQSDNRAITEALAANKIVLVPYEISDVVSARGYATLVGYAEDLLYFKVIADSYEIYVETRPDEVDILGQEVTLREWANKQDRLISGTNIKTINGNSILGSGNIVIEGGAATSGVYIADFYMHQLWGGEYIPFDIQALQEAIEANNIIYIPNDENDGSQGGCVATALIEDMIYLTIFGDMGTVYLIEIDFGSTEIDPLRITERYPILSINDLPTGSRMVIRPRQRKLSVSNGQTLALLLHDYSSVVQPLSSVTLLLPSVEEENNVQQCGVTFTTGTSTPVVRYQGGSIWWEGGVAPTIEANAVVEFVFTWHWQKSVWIGKCTIYK